MNNGLQRLVITATALAMLSTLPGMALAQTSTAARPASSRHHVRTIFHKRTPHRTPSARRTAAVPTIGGYPVSETLHLTATAYGPSLQDNYPYGAIDYFGKPLVAGDVAVDPGIIPLGTLLWVTGYSSPILPAEGFFARAVDTGDAIQGNRIDIFINASEHQVANFGIQDVTAFVLK